MDLFQEITKLTNELDILVEQLRKNGFKGVIDEKDSIR